MLTYNQAAWTALPQATNTLITNYFGIYQPFGILEIGIPGSSGYSIQFTSSTTVANFIPTNGTPSALIADVVDPIITDAGVFAGDVLALQLDLDYGDNGALTGTSGLLLGDLLIHDLTGATAGLNGLSVRAIDSIVNTALGGGATGYAISDLDLLAGELTNSFNNGVVTTFAEDHLVAPTKPVSGVPEPSTLVLLASGIAALGAIRRLRPRGSPSDQ